MLIMMCVCEWGGVGVGVEMCRGRVYTQRMGNEASLYSSVSEPLLRASLLACVVMVVIKSSARSFRSWLISFCFCFLYFCVKNEVTLDKP
jgi:hypothetical protein